MSHRERGQFRRYVHENFKKFKLITTPMGSWWASSAIVSQLPVGAEIILNFSKFHEHRDRTVHTFDGTQYTPSNYIYKKLYKFKLLLLHNTIKLYFARLYHRNDGQSRHFWRENFDQFETIVFYPQTPPGGKNHHFFKIFTPKMTKLSRHFDGVSWSVQIVGPCIINWIEGRRGRGGP